MARVTIEDCIEKMPNRFDLIVYASQRAREISSGFPLTLDRDNDKNPVVALREIAEGNFTAETLRENRITDLMKVNEKEENEEFTASVDEEATYLERRRLLADSGVVEAQPGTSLDDVFSTPSRRHDVVEAADASLSVMGTEPSDDMPAQPLTPDVAAVFADVEAVGEVSAETPEPAPAVSGVYEDESVADEDEAPASDDDAAAKHEEAA